MQDPLVYEYAVIRVVPRVEREEFINVGIIAFCKKTNELFCTLALNTAKLACINKDVDIAMIQANLTAFSEIAAGVSDSGSKIALLDAASRFRWLTAARSTVIQCSKVHPGITYSTALLSARLMQRFVL